MFLHESQRNKTTSWTKYFIWRQTIYMEMDIICHVWHEKLYNQDCSIKFLQYFKAEKGHEWHKLHLHGIIALFIKCDHNRTLKFHHLNIFSMFWYLNWLFNCNAKIKSLKLAFNFASSHHILCYGHFLIYFLQIKAIPPSSQIPKSYRNSHLPCLSTVTLLNNSGHIRMCVGGVLQFQLVDY